MIAIAAYGTDKIQFVSIFFVFQPHQSYFVIDNILAANRKHIQWIVHEETHVISWSPRCLYVGTDYFPMCQLVASDVSLVRSFDAADK